MVCFPPAFSVETHTRYTHTRGLMLGKYVCTVFSISTKIPRDHLYCVSRSDGGEDTFNSRTVSHWRRMGKGGWEGRGGGRGGGRQGRK